MSSITQCKSFRQLNRIRQPWQYCIFSGNIYSRANAADACKHNEQNIGRLKHYHKASCTINNALYHLTDDHDPFTVEPVDRRPS